MSGSSASAALSPPGLVGDRAPALRDVVAACAFVYLLGAAPGVLWLAVVAALCVAMPLDSAVRRGLGVAIVVAAAVVYSSREIAASWSDDLANVYYPLYLGLRDGSSDGRLPSPTGDFIVSSLELALPLLLSLVAALPFTLSAPGFVFALTLAGGLLYVCWVEVYLLPDLPPSRRGPAMAVSLTLFSFGLCSQVARQMLGVPVLLAAIWEARRSRAWVLAGLSAAFHLTAVPIFVLWRLIAIRPRLAIAAIAAVSVAMLSRFDTLGEMLLGADAGALDKLQFYAQFNDEVSGFSQRYLPIMVALAVLGWFARWYRGGRIALLVLAFSLLYVALLPLPLASFRLNLFALGGLLGPMFALAAVRRVGDRAFAFGAFALCVLMIARRVLVADTESGMGLWHSFSVFEIVPFRYVGLWLS